MSSYSCPDCGRTFDRAQALGAHRRQAHGVTGSSASAARARRRKTANGASGVDSDRLLQTLFPNGIPARVDVVRGIHSWLDEAERLAGLC
jgi:hypothetical protein